MALFGTGKIAFQPGFRDLKWGDAPTAQMTVDFEDGDDKGCLRASDKMEIEGAAVTEIKYFFYRNRLNAVLIAIAAGGVPSVFETFKAMMGPPTAQPNPYIFEYHWTRIGEGKEATSALLKQNSVTFSGMAQLSSDYELEQKAKREAYLAKKTAKPPGTT
jgi:hypothetical protein